MNGDKQSFHLEQFPVGRSTRGHHPELVIVQSVHQADEPPGLGPVLLAEDRDVPDDDCVEHLGHFQVVISPQRAGTELLKQFNKFKSRWWFPSEPRYKDS